jgi:hypothetical protein
MSISKFMLIWFKFDLICLMKWEAQITNPYINQKSNFSCGHWYMLSVCPWKCIAGQYQSKCSLPTSYTADTNKFEVSVSNCIYSGPLKKKSHWSLLLH